MLANIKRLCSERNVSLQELGKACGFGVKSIYVWAENPTKSIERLKRVANYFDVTVDELLQDDEKE